MPAQGVYTGQVVKASRPHTFNAVIEDLAHGKSANGIAAHRRVSTNTVAAIARTEAKRIETRKKTLAVMFETICEKSVRRATKTVKTATYAQAMVGAGIAADKMLALRGEAQQDRGLTINLLNVTSGNL